MCPVWWAAQDRAPWGQIGPCSSSRVLQLLTCRIESATFESQAQFSNGCPVEPPIVQLWHVGILYILQYTLYMYILAMLIPAEKSGIYVMEMPTCLCAIL